MTFLNQAISAALVAMAPLFTLVTSFYPSPMTSSHQAGTVRANPTVAALFGASSQTTGHTCTASVVSSATGDLLITAAHCLSGTGNGTGITVAPGYDKGTTPYGVWSVNAVFVDPVWKIAQSDADDIAILRVAPRLVNGVTRQLQDVTTANTLSDTPDTETAVTVQGFNTGTDDEAISCTTGLVFTHGNPTFGCDGYVGGSSGSPWLITGADGVTRVTGVIGGLDQGGCTSQTSYSPLFGTTARNLLARAEQAGATGDTTPPAGDTSGCSGIAMN
ncbi:MAG: trypsin-like peptidase domain-containing protein [Actinomycetota bacterium]|nr:trypsin-like peptidase domain-containing protein [Actinomycetota bacterium]